MSHIVVIGAGHAGGSVVDALRRSGYEGEITLIGEEAHVPYQRPPLSKAFLAGKIAEERLYLRPESFYEKKDISLRLSSRVTAIDPSLKKVTLQSGEIIKYDRLILATGSKVRRLNLSGTDDPRVHYLRTIDDTKQAQKGLNKAEKIAIIGGGFIGLECAAVLRSMGKDVIVFEAQMRVMERVLAAELSSYYQDLHRAHGVKIQLNAGVTAIQPSQDSLIVSVDGSDNVFVDMVFIGVGIIPETILAEGAGLAVDNGIVVDDQCRTSDKDIFAIGECCNHPNVFAGGRARLESVQNAVDQAKLVAAIIMGEDAHYNTVPWFWSDQYDIKLQMAGFSAGFDQAFVRGNKSSGHFSVLYYRADKLIAVDSIASAADHMAARKLIAAGISPEVEQAINSDVPLKSFL